MINTKEITVGQKFKYEDKSWICTSNNGFIFRADNLDTNDVETNIMFVGLYEDVEII